MASSSPYHTRDSLDNDLIDPDDPTLNDLDDPLHARNTDRAPLTGNIQSDRTRQPIPQGYLNSAIGGEDRRAATNTIDESVWATLSRDLQAVWEKMRLVLWPNHLLGGFLQRGGSLNNSSSQDAERAEAGEGLMGRVQGLVGRWPDADVVLQSGMSDGLRNWDLWGPLLFCLLLSLFLSFRAAEGQEGEAFSGIFAIIWVGEAVITVQIKLLGGNISFFQSVCIIGYTLFPLVIGSLVSALVSSVLIRAPVLAVLVLWSLAAGVSILGGSGVLKNRVGLAVYPLLIFYVALGCLCLVS